MRRVDPEKIAAALATQSKVVAAWVFGSAAGGEIAAGADLDVGVLFRDPPTLDDLCETRAALQRALELEEIDLVPLNEASPILRFEAVSGQRVFCRDTAAGAEFVSLTAREYEDETALLARQMMRS